MSQHLIPMEKKTSTYIRWPFWNSLMALSFCVVCRQQHKRSANGHSPNASLLYENLTIEQHTHSTLVSSSTRADRRSIELPCYAAHKDMRWQNFHILLNVTNEYFGYTILSVYLYEICVCIIECVHYVGSVRCPRTAHHTCCMLSNYFRVWAIVCSLLSMKCVRLCDCYRPPIYIRPPTNPKSNGVVETPENDYNIVIIYTDNHINRYSIGLNPWLRYYACLFVFQTINMYFCVFFFAPEKNTKNMCLCGKNAIKKCSSHEQKKNSNDLVQLTANRKLNANKMYLITFMPHDCISNWI